MVADDADLSDSYYPAHWLLVLHHAAVADGRRPYDELWQVAGTPHGQRQEKGYICRCGRCGRSETGARGSR